MSIFSFIFIIAIFQTAVFTLPAPDESNVDINIKRIRRQVRDSNPPEIQLSLSTSNSNYKASLSNPENSIFSPDFKYQIAEEDNDSKFQLKDVTPSPESIADIEKGHFVNPSVGAAFSVSSFEDNQNPKLRGFLGDLVITPKDDNTHSASNRKIDVPPPVTDFIDLKRNVTPGISTRAAVSVQPEVYVIFDNENFKTFNGNTKDIIDYIAVFFHGINNRFAIMSDPQITFRISGITAVSSPSAQPFMENNKTPDGTGNDIDKVLQSFSNWVYANRNTIPKHDMATVISGRDFKTKDSTGKYISSVSGMAYLKSACWVDTRGQRSLATSVGEDFGGYYDGIYTIAHEFAHNLNAPHDGSGESANCPWSDGYLMSYNGWGTSNKFRFSSCSIKLMKDFISSSGGTCLKTIENANPVPVSIYNPGDRLNMTELCRKYSKQPAAVVDSSRSPSSLCKNLVCKYPTPGKPAGWITTTLLNHPPGDNSPCGTAGGRCVYGECV